MRLGRTSGALVQDVTPGSPGERAGIRPYDMIVSVDGRAMTSNDELIQDIAARMPGVQVRLGIVRDGRERTMTVRLAERPQTTDARDLHRGRGPDRPSPSDARPAAPSLGLTVDALTRQAARELGIPDAVGGGVVISEVEPLSAAADAALERGTVILEINREPIESVADYRRIVDAAQPGDVFALYLYIPTAGQRALRTVRFDAD